LSHSPSHNLHWTITVRARHEVVCVQYTDYHVTTYWCLNRSQSAATQRNSTSPCYKLMPMCSVVRRSNKIKTISQWCIAPLTPLARWTRLVSAPVVRTRRNQHDAARALACARRRIDVAGCNSVDIPPRGPLCVNMTSSIKPEVHNVSQRHQRRTNKPRSGWLTGTKVR